MKHILPLDLPLLITVRGTDRLKEATLSHHTEGFACLFEGGSRELRREVISFLEGYAAREHRPLPPIDVAGLTPFTRSVLHQLTQIPCGETRTYAQIAARLACPKGARAVGGACGRNPLLFFLPCHRVVASTGLGGFSGGLSFKEMLLSFELQPN